MTRTRQSIAIMQAAKKVEEPPPEPLVITHTPSEPEPDTPDEQSINHNVMITAFLAMLTFVMLMLWVTSK